MEVKTARTLLIDDGDLPSLTVTSIQPVSAELVLWHRLRPGLLGRRLLECVRRHAALPGVEEVLVHQAAEQLHRLPDPASLKLRPIARPDGQPLVGEAAILLQAIAVALDRGCRRLLWPIRVGPDLDRLAPLIGMVGSFEAIFAADPACDLAIDLPLVDLTERQVVDLALDSGGPLDAFWPSEEPLEADADRRPPDHCPVVRRWRSAFEGLGVDWPWGGRAEAGEPVEAAPAGREHD